MAQVQMPEPSGIRCRRLDSSRGFQTASRGASAGLLRQWRQAHLCRTRRHGHAG